MISAAGRTCSCLRRPDRYGKPDEARLLVDQLGHMRPVPVLAVLGNHEFECGKQDELCGYSRAGVTVLDGTMMEILKLDLRNQRFCGLRRPRPNVGRSRPQAARVCRGNREAGVGVTAADASRWSSCITHRLSTPFAENQQKFSPSRFQPVGRADQSLR
jgi:hypothetical protein